VPNIILARFHQVVTRYYRAPELIYGADEYGAAVDMWAIGCIFAELMLRIPFFPGESDIDQLGKVFHALGTPTEETWPGMTALKAYVAYKPCEPTPLKQIFTGASPDALDLLQQFLYFDPNKRISAEEAMKHVYFTNAPSPTLPEDLPKLSAKPNKRSSSDAGGGGLGSLDSKSGTANAMKRRLMMFDDEEGF
jgi:cyclin-dependent kinase 7